MFMRNTGTEKLNIVDLLLLDHEYLKECIQVLTNEDADKKHKLVYAKGFLDTLKKHSDAEKKAVYTVLVEREPFHQKILEAKIEHGIADTRVRLLIPRVKMQRLLKEEMEAEMKVLAEIVEHHIKEEESELFPLMKKTLETDLLHQMGFEFMKLRQFSEKDLEGHHDIQEEFAQWKTSAHPIKPQNVQDLGQESLKH